MYNQSLKIPKEQSESVSQKNRQHNVDNKGVISKHISKRTDNAMAWPTVPNKKTNTDLQNTTQKTKD